MTTRELQRLDALGRANEIRTKRRELKDATAGPGGEKFLASVIQRNPDWLQTMRVRTALGAIPYMGPKKVKHAIRWMGLGLDDQFWDLDAKQREDLIRSLSS